MCFLFYYRIPALSDGRLNAAKNQNYSEPKLKLSRLQVVIRETSQKSLDTLENEVLKARFAPVSYDNISPPPLLSNGPVSC